MEVLGFDETFCPELPLPSKKKHRKAADVPTCKLMHLEELTSSVLFLNGKTFAILRFFFRKWQNNKKTKRNRIFCDFKGFLGHFSTQK